MTNYALSEIAIGKTLDNRGSDCASGFAKLLDVMDELQSGEVLQILSTDRAARRELSEWSERSGNELLHSDTSGPLWAREYRFLIRKA